MTLDLTGYTAEADEKGVSILGAGRGVTEVIQGTAGAGITVLGGTSGAAAHHHVTIADFKVNGFDNAIRVQNGAFMHFRDLFSIGGDLMVQLEDVLSCRFTNVYARFGRRGIYAKARTTFTNPNSLTFYGCHIGKCPPMARGSRTPLACRSLAGHLRATATMLLRQIVRGG